MYVSVFIDMRAKRLDRANCNAVEATLSVIGGVWKPMIVYHLLGGRKRFMELTRLIPSATQRMITLQLREMEVDGLINRHVYAEVPPKVEYELTVHGQSLAPVLKTLYLWGERYQRERLGIEPAKRCESFNLDPAAEPDSSLSHAP